MIEKHKMNKLTKDYMSLVCKLSDYDMILSAGKDAGVEKGSYYKFANSGYVVKILVVYENLCLAHSANSKKVNTGGPGTSNLSIFNIDNFWKAVEKGPPNWQLVTEEIPDDLDMGAMCFNVTELENDKNRRNKNVREKRIYVDV